MSTQRGNTSRSRKQKHQNSTAFKNDLHDKSQKTKMIKNLTAEGICQRCKDIIDWKIKYKKYKPLTQPSTCVRCHNKTVKRAYYTVCQPCATSAEVCAKCNSKQPAVIEPPQSEQEKILQDRELQFELRQLKERERRTFHRHNDKGDTATAMSIVAGISGDNEDEEDFTDEEDFINGMENITCGGAS